MRICLTLPFDDSESTSASFALPYGIAVIASIIKEKHPSSEVFFSNNESEIVGADGIWCSRLSESWDLVNQLGEKAVNLNQRFIVG